MLAEKIQDKEKNEEKKAELLEKYTKEYNQYKNKEAKAFYLHLMGIESILKIRRNW